jgi:hypothetical protein
MRRAIDQLGLDHCAKRDIARLLPHKLRPTAESGVRRYMMQALLSSR